jgi:hypothetical protein
LITDYQSAVLLTGFIFGLMTFIGAYALHLVFRDLADERRFP